MNMMNISLLGAAQANSYASGLEKMFRFLADHPNAARERTETRTPVRACRYKRMANFKRLSGDRPVKVHPIVARSVDPAVLEEMRVRVASNEKGRMDGAPPTESKSVTL